MLYNPELCKVIIIISMHQQQFFLLYTNIVIREKQILNHKILIKSIDNMTLS